MESVEFIEDEKLIEFKITGKVQGVGYRYWLKGVANKLRIKGCVKNKNDGSVRVVAAGQDGSLNKMMNACYIGPKLAKVESIKIYKVKILNKKILNDFVIK